MILTVVAFLSLAIWLYLLLGRGLFWLCRERDDTAYARLAERGQAPAPSVVAVIPARDEADAIGASVASLLKQDYAGRFSIVVVDDQSSDGTAEVARRTAAELGAEARVKVVSGSSPPKGWTGKLWAMRQGLAALDAGGAPPDFILFTDADIAYAPSTLKKLVAIAGSTRSVLVSLMAKLRCVSFAERVFAPAFIYFFQKLYPFAWVNDAARGAAGAAGGCMLVRPEALAAAGGLETLRNAIIDDCALAAAMKRQGPIWLGLTENVVSLRAHADFTDFGSMIVRSAFAQLRYSPLLLIGTVAGMLVTYAAPPLLALLARGPAEWAGLIAWVLMAISFMPMLRFYRQPRIYAFALPLVAAAYTGYTIESALQYWRGRGGRWKGRYQASVSRGGGA